MKISVAQVSENEGLTIRHRYAEGEPALAGTDSKLAGHAVLEARVSREGERVELRGRIEAKVEFECDRCLAPVSFPVRQAFELNYVPPLGTAEEMALAEKDLSIGFYRDGEIDVDDVVREQVELAVPMARVCREDCKGLCPECGANLNEAPCGCAGEHSDPRWGALKDLKFDS
jgi:uncharacterized protein